MLLVCRFAVDPADADAFTARARHALGLLTAASGAEGGRLGRSVDDEHAWILQVRFASVDDYRRALSPFPVREHVVPLLSEARTDGPSTFETLADAVDGTVLDRPSLRTP